MRTVLAPPPSVPDVRNAVFSSGGRNSECARLGRPPGLLSGWVPGLGWVCPPKQTHPCPGVSLLGGARPVPPRRGMGRSAHLFSARVDETPVTGA
jgi:hypothetical protein